MTKKLQNSFNDFLPQNYQTFRRSIAKLNSNQAVVAELLRICCEENNVKAIEVAFERILGKPERVIVIKRTLVTMLYPDAKRKALKPVIDTRVKDELDLSMLPESKVVIDAASAPGILLRKELDIVGEKSKNYAYEVIDAKNQYTVAQVMAANLYAIAMKGSNLSAITLLFDYLDGAVADVIRLDGEDTIMLENYSDIAPYEAKKGENGVWYVELEVVK